MPARLQVDMAEGRKLSLGGGGGDDGTGLAEVSVGGTIAKASAEAFGKGLATLGDLFRMLDGAVSALPKRPKGIEMEFRAKLTGECDLWVVSGEGEAEFTVKVSWGGDAPKG
jgi:hypothetical protein